MVTMSTNPDTSTSTTDDFTETEGFQSTEVSIASTAFPASTEDDTVPGDGGNVAVIVGSVIGGLVVVALITALIVILVIKRDRIFKVCLKEGEGHDPPSRDLVDKSEHNGAFAENPVMQPSPMKDIEKNDPPKSSHSQSRPYVTTKFQPHESKAKLLRETSANDDFPGNGTGFSNTRFSNNSGGSNDDNIYKVPSNSHSVVDEVSDESEDDYKVPPHNPKKVSGVSKHPNHTQVHSRESEGIFDDIYDHPKTGQTNEIGYDDDRCDSMPVEPAPGIHQTQQHAASEDEGVFDDIYDHPKKGQNVQNEDEICDSIPLEQAPWPRETHNEPQGIFDDIYDSPKGTAVDYDADVCESIPQEQAPALPQPVFNGGDNDDSSSGGDEYDVPPSIHRNKTVPPIRDSAQYANFQSVPQAQTLPVGTKPPPSHRPLTKDPSYTNFQAVQRHKESGGPKPHPHKASGDYVNYPSPQNTS